MRELTNILTPGFTEIKSKNQACGLIAHNVYEALGLRRWRLVEKTVRNKTLNILLSTCIALPRILVVSLM